MSLSFVFSVDEVQGVHGPSVAGGPGKQSNLGWENVALATVFVLFNAIMSMSLGLNIETPLIIAAARCIIQLTIMGLILEDVFKVRQLPIVLLLVGIMILLATYETVYNASKKTFAGMFPIVFLSTAFSTILVGVIGMQCTLDHHPFWIPETFIPTTGLLLGSIMSGMAMGLNSFLASAGKSVAIESIQLAMLPTISQMSVIGLISIPGTMTGQILSGSPIMTAVKYQQIIMFLITASTSTSILISVMSCVRIVIDTHHRIRPDRIRDEKQSVLQDSAYLVKQGWQFLCYRYNVLRQHSQDEELERNQERQPLLLNDPAPSILA